MIRDRSAPSALDLPLASPQHDLHSDVEFDKCPGRMLTRVQSIRWSALREVDVAEQSFAHTMDRIAASLRELQRGHEEFDPRVSPVRMSVLRGSHPGQRSSIIGSPLELSKQEREQWAERFEAYKMVRRIEPELAPLSFADFPVDARTPQSQAIVAHNASPEALQRFVPDARKERLRDKKEKWESRRQGAVAQRKLQLCASEQQISEALARKQQQAEVAIASKRASKGTKGAAEFHGKSNAEFWLSFCFCAAFAKRLVGDRDLYKEGRWQPNEESLNGFKMFALFFRRKKQVAAARSQARVIWSSMHQWKTSGRIFMSMRRTAKSLKQLQAWWRRCSKRLREVRDKLSRRWERLERAEVDRSPPSPRMPTSEDRSRQGMVAEAVRLRFIEHELRARRFFLLPQIRLWEEDSRKWQEHRRSLEQRWAAERRRGGSRSSSKAGTPAELFVWPPLRPTHLPQGHRRAEAYGVPCPRGCFGRKGDQEILQWVRTARTNPRGWTKIPGSDVPRAIGSRSRSHSAGARRRRRHRMRFLPEQEPASSFSGMANDEDLRRWGLDPKAMPGLNGASLRPEAAVNIC